MRKTIGLVFALVICAALSGCGDRQMEEIEVETSLIEMETTTVPAEEPIRVCVVYNGDLQTKEENLLFQMGVQRAVDSFGAECLHIESSDEEKIEQNLLAACEEGYDMIIGADPVVADAIAKYGAEYPAVAFAVLDAEVPLENMKAVYVDLKDAFFLAGALAAEKTVQTEHPGTDEGALIGWIGGMNIPIVQEYFAAFQSGIQSVNPKIQILERYVGSWDEPEEGRLVALGVIDQGADVILSLAGDADPAILETARENGIYTIGLEESLTEGKEGSILASIFTDMEQVGYQVTFEMLENLQKDVSEHDSVQILSFRDGCVGLHGLDDFEQAAEWSKAFESSGI